MRILFLSRWYPYPPDNGSKLRVSGLLRGLCQQHEVSLISFVDPTEVPAEPAAGEPGPVSVQMVPFHDFQPRSARAMLGFVSGRPRFLVDTHSDEMDARIRDAVRTTRFDLVIASQLSMAAYHRSFEGIPAIFEEVELGIYRPVEGASETRWERLRRELTWAKHRRFMGQLVRQFTLCTVASEVERRLVRDAVPDGPPVHIVPNSVSGIEAVAAEKKPNALIFTGSLRYAPNREALTWFVEQVYPQVQSAVEGVSLTVTGETGAAPVPAARNLVLTGRVADVRPLVAGASVSIAPILSGGGTRLKVLEAMALGTPVVATPKAVEGLDVHHGEHLLIAPTAAAFAGAIERLLADPAAASAMAARARVLFRERYDSNVVVPEFLRLVEQAAA